MIIDKKQAVQTTPLSDPSDSEVQDDFNHRIETVQEAVETNPLVDAYHAVRSILESLTEDPEDPNSGPLFKTIKLDNGQLNRIVNSKANTEYGLAFPAAFIHYVNIYYNQGVSKIANGKGTMRIHYVLNRLNNSDDKFEEEGFVVYKRIVDAIESNKSTFPALVSKFQLSYWDQPLSFDDGVQPYWIDYEIWFNDYTSYTYKNYVDAYFTIPPFTQPSDQNETANPDHRPDYDEPTLDDASGYDLPDATNTGEDQTPE